MNTYGLMPKFKVNRPLNQEEKEQPLDKNERNDIPNERLGASLNVIKINSTYLEVVDKYYTTKGVYSLMSMMGVLLFSCFLIVMLITLITNNRSDYWFLLILLIIFSPVGYLAYYNLKHEYFLKTHYPIRFNRKTRMVYAYRVDGSIISASWDNIYFTTGLGRFKTPMDDYYISGHILSDDKQTIIDTFCLPESSPTKESLINHWEFIRRYMEEGVEPVIDSINYYLPIENRKETPKESYLYLLGLAVSFTIIFLPFAIIMAIPIWLSRCLAIRLSKRPIWPDEINTLCQIDHDDPYQRDATFNKNAFWKTVVSLQGKL